MCQTGLRAYFIHVYRVFSFWPLYSIPKKGNAKECSNYHTIALISHASKLCPTLCDPMDCSSWNSPGQNIGVGSLSLFQGIFPTQGSNPGLPHFRRIFYQLSHKGSPRILEWVT